jgi:hypothetical protein
MSSKRKYRQMAKKVKELEEELAEKKWVHARRQYVAAKQEETNELEDLIFTKETKRMSDEKTVKRVLKYEIYKTKGAFQFKLAPAWTIRDRQSGNLRDKGCIFIDAAPSVGERKYGFKDDTKKITFALGVTDIGQILTGFKLGKFNLVHDPGAQTEKRGQIVKQFSMWKGNNDDDGLPTFFIKLTQESGGQKKEVSIPLKAYEVRILNELLAAAIPRILYWN